MPQLSKHTKKLLRIAVVVVVLAASAAAIVKSIWFPIDEFGTKEITLVRRNASTFCQSCMGLYK